MRHTLVVFLVILLAACGASSSVTTYPPPSNDVPNGNQPIRLMLWHAWPSSDQPVLSRLIDRYNQTHPHIQVVLHAVPISSLTRELRTATLAGNGPHLIMLQNHTIGSLAQDGILLPLDNLIEPDERLGLLPATIRGAEVQMPDGTLRLYGLPITFDTLALYYHKAYLQTPPADIETMLSTAHRVTDSTDQTHWGLAYTLSFDKTIGYLSAFGGYVFDTQGNLVLGEEGRAGTEQWLDWLLHLREDRKILAANDSIMVDSSLKSQKAVMTIDWSHMLPVYQSLWGDNLGVATLPEVGSTGRAPQPYVQSTVISINARVVGRQEQQAAQDVVRYFVSADAQHVLLEAGEQPSLLSLSLEGTTAQLQAARIFRTQAQHGQPMPNNPVINGVVRNELERMQRTVLRGLATPTDAVTHADSALREHLRTRRTPSQDHQNREPDGAKGVLFATCSTVSWFLFAKRCCQPVALHQKM